MFAPRYLYFLFPLFCLVCGCGEEPARFRLIEPQDSGIDFANTIQETDSLHYFNFPYIYAGGGVGIADFDRDGLPDIFFSGNSVSARLYRNRGDFRFEDITQTTGVETNSWTTGVAIADVNQDGWPDIYLSVGGYGETSQLKNRLFINQGDMTFTESAAAYGIADEGHATQSAFFDYDGDGDLDLYVMNYANESYAIINNLHTYTDGTGLSTDRLYQNTGTDSLGHPYFKNVSREAGILIEGYGLGLAIADLNQDGWPDIYVANDFITSDLLYINQQDGTFANRLQVATQQSSQNGMGVDIADFNNDGLADIVVMDMLPESNHRQKMMTANVSYEFFRNTLRKGFAPQFIRNTLQVNRGVRPDGNPAFSEVGRMAGIHQTDWSWAPLFADFDNDGLLDLYITNGLRRDVTDHDFQEYHVQIPMVEQGTGQLSIPKVLAQLFQLDSVYLPNYLFLNRGGIHFEDQTQAWGMKQASMSNGAAYADFDGDGDLDLVVSNINAPAFLYRNESARDNHFLKISLEGPAPNRDGTGAKIIARLPGGRVLFRENYPIRGYMSSVEPGIHMGLGTDSLVEELEIIWPDGSHNVYPKVRADSAYRLTYGGGFPQSPAIIPENKGATPMFEELTGALKVDFQHRENVHSDFKLEPLLPHLYDYYGPGIAVGDINGDGREDFYIGGARDQAGRFFLQEANGSFVSRPLEGAEMYEDMGALLLDVDGDKDLDLYVVSGGSSVKYFQKGHYQDRLYRNQGAGNFMLDPDALPEMPASGSCVVAADFDADGDLDLFVGGRIVPGRFPLAPRSYLLENRNGRFHDVTQELAPELVEVGLVSAALWTDYDNDNDADLMLVGEWMPITLFENRQGQLRRAHVPAFDASSGLWNSLAGSDIDHDGDIDYVAGNLGANTAWKVQPGEPIRLYAKDFDDNGSVDAILTRYMQGKEYPVAPRGALISQIESIKKLFPNYQKFSEAGIHQILSAYDTTDMLRLEARCLLSSYIENLGEGKFAIHPLPQEAQWAPIFGLEISDVDADGHEDLLGIGNYYPTEVLSGWYDAHTGLVLRGEGTGAFSSVAGTESGFWVEGDARALTRVSAQNGDDLVLAAVNNDTLRVFRKKSAPKTRRVSWLPGEIRATLQLKDGRTMRCERYWGQGYLSQASGVWEIHENVRSVTLFDGAGTSRTLRFD